jgi:hypothetical protein
MWSLEVINQLNKEAGDKARAQRVEPYFIHYPEEIDGYPPFPFPNIGDDEPEGWEQVDDFFCDSSGFGSSSEPALTPEQLKRKLEPGFGYAIIETGQFQLVIGKFKRV